MAQSTQKYSRSLSGSIGAGMKSLMGGSGRRYYVLEHKVSSKYHKAGENQRIIVDQIELGRDPKCQVRFDENFGTVSRRHAAIVKDGDNWKLVQLSKTNSTYLNGHKVDKEWYLQNGDEIQLSTNGPKMGFIVPEGDKGLVKSIGLSQRLSLFRQQALRPYKQAIAALACVFVISIGICGYFLVQQHDLIEQYQARNLQNTEEFNRKLAQQESNRQNDSIRYEQESRRMREEHAREIAAVNSRTSRAIADAEARARQRGSSETGFAAMVQEQNIPKDVYFLQTTKVVYIADGQEHPITSGNNAYGWCGTGFLMNDGKFVTARHCIEGWLYSDPVGDDMVSAVVRASASNPNIKIKAYFVAVSSISNTKFSFTSDDFRINHTLDKKAQIGTDDSGNAVYWPFAFPAMEGMSESMWSTDWAYTTRTNGKKGDLIADPALSQSLLPMQKLVVGGFPRAIGVLDGNQQVEPIFSELTTSRSGLANNGCIMHSRGTDHGNSGGPIFAIKDGKLVVVGIVSRGDHRTTEHNWAVPISKIQ